MSEADQKAAAKVRAAERAMHDARRKADEAAERKEKAKQWALDAARRAQNPSGWDWFNEAEHKAEKASAYYKDARTQAMMAEGAFVDTGKAYVDAENDYLRTTGGYYNEQQYATVKDQIHYSAAANAHEAHAATPEQAQQEAQSIQKALQSGKMGLGEMAAKSQGLSKLGDDLVAQTLDSSLTRGGDLAPAEEPESWTAQAGSPGAGSGGPSAAANIGYGRPAGTVDGLRSDKAILLSGGQTGDMRGAAGRRLLSAAGDSLSDGDPRGALRAAEAALKEDPRNAKAWTMKAAALNKLGRYGDAESAAQRAVQLDRGNFKGYRELTWAQLHNGKADAAEASATQMVILEPDNPEGYLMRAFAYELKNDRERMLADLQRAAALDPRFANHLARAKAGIRLFDPSASDNENLLSGLSAPPVKRANPLTLLGAVFLALAASAAAARALVPAVQRWRRNSAAAAPKPAAGPAPVAAARLQPVESDGLLAGRYRLKRVAGRGGMGIVWEGMDVSLRRQVALKEMAPELAGDPALRELYIKEARTIATLHHPNIVEIFEILDLKPQLYLVFEWVSGKTLAHVLAEKRTVPLDAARAVLAPVCEALAFAHEHGVVHRDLKPGNVMVSADAHVKLMDFGVARASGAVAASAVPAATPTPNPIALTRTRTIAGTPGYRPPDAERGVVGPAFDVFSLGVCLYELLSGELPFGPDGWAAERALFKPLTGTVPGVSPALDELLVRALDPDPETRLSDARAFKSALLKA